MFKFWLKGCQSMHWISLEKSEELTTVVSFRDTNGMAGSEIYCSLFRIVRLLKFWPYASIILSKKDDIFRKLSCGNNSSHSTRDLSLMMWQSLLDLKWFHCTLLWKVPILENSKASILIATQTPGLKRITKKIPCSFSSTNGM